MLQNRFYLGEAKDPNGMWIPSSSHEALIDRDTFNRAQEMVQGRHTSKHYTNKIKLPFRGFITCECGRTYTPYIKKGKYIYFSRHCTKDCVNALSNIKLDAVEDAVGELLERLRFTPEELEQLNQLADAEMGNIGRKIHNEAWKNSVRKKRINDDIRYLVENRIRLLQSQAFTPEEYRNELDRLNEELKNVPDERTSVEALSETAKETVEIAELLKTLVDEYKNAKTPQKEAFARKVCAELIIETRDGKPSLKAVAKSGLQPFMNRPVSLSALLGNLAELIILHEDLVSLSEHDRSAHRY
jgi:hypothetical protein